MAKAVLIDLSGFAYVGRTLLPGAAEALDRLDEAGMPYRFVTNTTRKPKRKILELLRSFGLDITNDALCTPTRAACDWRRDGGTDGRRLHYINGHDMLKAAEKSMRIEGIRLLAKDGGKSGEFRAAPV